MYSYHAIDLNVSIGNPISLCPISTTKPLLLKYPSCAPENRRFQKSKYKLKMNGVLFPSLINGLQIQLILLSSNCLFNLISGCRVQLRSLTLERMYFLCSIAEIDVIAVKCHQSVCRLHQCPIYGPTAPKMTL